MSTVVKEKVGVSLYSAKPVLRTEREYIVRAFRIPFPSFTNINAGPAHCGNNHKNNVKK